MSDNRFTHLNKSQSRAVAEAFTAQAEVFRFALSYHEANLKEQQETWGDWHQFTDRPRGTISAYRLCIKDAEERAAEALEIAEGRR